MQLALICDQIEWPLLQIFSEKIQSRRKWFCKLDKEFSSRRGLKLPAARELNRGKDFPKGMFDSKGPKLNVLIRDKISFVGVAHLTHGGRSCSWALYHRYKNELHRDNI